MKSLFLLLVDGSLLACPSATDERVRAKLGSLFRCGEFTARSSLQFLVFYRAVLRIIYRARLRMRAKSSE